MLCEGITNCIIEGLTCVACHAVDSLSSGSSQAEEECLRPSRIRRKFHLFHDITNLSTAVNSSPLQDIMALASPTPCASNRPASACFSPNAETNLFGSPVPSVYTPAARHQHGIGHSMAVQSPRLQHLQKQHTALLQNLNVSPSCSWSNKQSVCASPQRSTSNSCTACVVSRTKTATLFA